MPTMPASRIASPIKTRIREFANVSEAVSPQEIAASFLEALPDEEVRETLAETLPHYISAIVGLNRQGHGKEPRQGTPRYERLVNDLEIYRQREWLNGDWRELGDCSASEVHELGDSRLVQARRLKRTADGYFRLAAHMQKEGLRIVRDVPAETVVQFVSY